MDAAVEKRQVLAEPDAKGAYFYWPPESRSHTGAGASRDGQHRSPTGQRLPANTRRLERLVDAALQPDRRPDAHAATGLVVCRGLSFTDRLREHREPSACSRSRTAAGDGCARS